jgi:uncharacterized membrane protein
MFKILLALHLLTAIFAIGPLVGAATTASRGLRTGDAGATDSAARTLTIYSYASVLVVILGFGLMSAKAPWNPDEKVADFGDTWIWLSVLLWLVSMALVLAVTVPALKQAATAIGSGGTTDRLVARVAASGGVVGLIFAAIVFLMVYRPGGN